MTDAEINEAVAKALGLDFVGVSSIPGHEGEAKVNGAVAGSNTPYPWIFGCWATSVDACFRDLVPETRGRGLEIMLSDDRSSDCYIATFFDGGMSRELQPRGVRIEAGDPSPSRALCLAWLKTKEVA